MMRGAVVWLLTLLHVGTLAAHIEANPKMIAGVPVYNYHLAHLARVGHAPKDHPSFLQMMKDAEGGGTDPADVDDIEWIVVMKDDSSDKQVDDLCHDSAGHGCLGEGHPTEHGVPVAGVKATVAGLTKLLHNHSKEVTHVEPNLPIFIPPAEGHIDETKSAESLLQVQAESLLFEAREDKYFVLRWILEGFVTGQEFAEEAGALDRFKAIVKTGDVVAVVDKDFIELAYSGQRSEGIEKDMLDWWTTHTGRKPKKAPPPTPAPTLAPEPDKPKDDGNADKPDRGPMPDGNTRRRRSKDKKAPHPLVWGLDRIDDKQGLDGSYDFVYDGHGVHIYVLDTGVKMDHMDFASGMTSRVIPTIEIWDNKPQECLGDNDVTCAVDRMGHGTHCAGSAAGEYSGVAKGATIHAVKVLGDDGRGSDLGVMMAIDWIMTKGKRPAVLSMSLGRRGKSESMATTLKKAIGAGLNVVVAAGNENADACNNSPAFVPEVITVGATTKEDSRADFSNYGECLDIFAPGKSIKSAYYAGNARFGTMSGTSMACPHVAGWMAMVLQANPTMKQHEIQALLKKESIHDKMLSTGPRSPDRMLYVSPNPTWARGKKAGSGEKSRRRRRAEPTSGSKNSLRRRSPRRRRTKKAAPKRPPSSDTGPAPVPPAPPTEGAARRRRRRGKKSASGPRRRAGGGSSARRRRGKRRRRSPSR